MDKLILYSPAKINIGLNIIRKRNDGYHDLETIFYPLLLSDVLTFNKANKTMLTSNSEEINNLGSNLVTDAITLLQENTKKELRVEIHLEKNIPVKFVGIGEEIDDLQQFDSSSFVNAIFS